MRLNPHLLNVYNSISGRVSRDILALMTIIVPSFLFPIRRVSRLIIDDSVLLYLLLVDILWLIILCATFLLPDCAVLKFLDC